MVRVGDPAPDFKLKGTDGKEHALANYKGKWVVLFFFPKAFTTVCQSEVAEFSKRSGDFAAAHAVVLGCSVDSDAALKAWAKHLGGLNITLLADLKKDVGRRYGVLLDHEGYHLRGTFLIDPEGRIRALTMNETETGRSMEESLRTLQALQTGASCPAEWRPGQPTL
jgi:peroxiredoxin (alkyl hydroperoxide reductase subunit C)